MVKKSKDEKLQALAKQQRERLNVFKTFFPQRELSDREKLERDKLADAMKKATPSLKEYPVYENEYDQNAHEIIKFAILLKPEQFLQFPDVDSETVYYIIKRMSEVERYNTEWQLKLKQQIPSAVKSTKTSEAWKPYIERFDELIRKGKTEAWAINKIGDEIERINKESIDKGQKPLFKTRKSPNTGVNNPRPSQSALRRQLVTNRK